MTGEKAEASGPTVRKARVGDVEAIKALVDHFARERRMLPRPLSEIYENIRDYYVVEDAGAVVGSAALHVFWEDLAEIRALAVAEKYQGRGLGRGLVAACCHEASGMGIRRVFALTFLPGFFHGLGFADIEKERLPQKIWSDCVRCPLFPECGEEAVILEVC